MRYTIYPYTYGMLYVVFFFRIVNNLLFWHNMQQCLFVQWKKKRPNVPIRCQSYYNTSTQLCATHATYVARSLWSNANIDDLRAYIHTKTPNTDLSTDETYRQLYFGEITLQDAIQHPVDKTEYKLLLAENKRLQEQVVHIQNQCDRDCKESVDNLSRCHLDLSQRMETTMRLENAIAKHRADKKRLQEEYEAVASQRQTLQKKLDTRWSSTEKEITALENTLNRCRRTKVQLEEKLRALRRDGIQATVATDRTNRLLAEKRRLDGRIQNLLLEVKTLKTRHKEVTEQYEDAVNAYENRTREMTLEIQSLHTVTERLRTELSEQQASCQQIKHVFNENVEQVYTLLQQYDMNVHAVRSDGTQFMLPTRLWQSPEIILESMFTGHAIRLTVNVPNVIYPERKGTHLEFTAKLHDQVYSVPLIEHGGTLMSIKEYADTVVPSCPGIGVDMVYSNVQQLLPIYLAPLSPYPGLLVYHDVGTGKTLTALRVLDTFKGRLRLWVYADDGILGQSEPDLKRMYGNSYGTHVQKYDYKTSQGVDPVFDISLDDCFRAFSNTSRSAGRPVRYTHNSGNYNGVFAKDGKPMEFEERKGTYVNTTGIDHLFQGIIVIDEAHKLLEEKHLETYNMLKAVVRDSREKSGRDAVKLMLLTATPLIYGASSCKKLLDLLLDDDLPGDWCTGVLQGTEQPQNVFTRYALYGLISRYGTEPKLTASAVSSTLEHRDNHIAAERKIIADRTFTVVTEQLHDEERDNVLRECQDSNLVDISTRFKEGIRSGAAGDQEFLREVLYTYTLSKDTRRRLLQAFGGRVGSADTQGRTNEELLSKFEAIRVGDTRNSYLELATTVMDVFTSIRLACIRNLTAINIKKNIQRFKPGTVSMNTEKVITQDEKWQFTQSPPSQRVLDIIGESILNESTPGDKHAIYCGVVPFGNKYYCTYEYISTLLQQKYSRCKRTLRKIFAYTQDDLKILLLSHGLTYDEKTKSITGGDNFDPAPDQKTFRLATFAHVSGDRKDDGEKDYNNLLKQIFNSPHNMNGKLIKAIILGPGQKQGISLYSVRHMHIIGQPPTTGELKQVMGRVFRRCGHEQLPAHKRNVQVHVYTTNLTESILEGIDQEDNAIGKLDLLLSYASIDYHLTQSVSDNTDKPREQLAYDMLKSMLELGQTYYVKCTSPSDDADSQYECHRTFHDMYASVYGRFIGSKYDMDDHVSLPSRIIPGVTRHTDQTVSTYPINYWSDVDEHSDRSLVTLLNNTLGSMVYDSDQNTNWSHFPDGIHGIAADGEDIKLRTLSINSSVVITRRTREQRQVPRHMPSKRISSFALYSDIPFQYVSAHPTLTTIDLLQRQDMTLRKYEEYFKVVTWEVVFFNTPRQRPGNVSEPLREDEMLGFIAEFDGRYFFKWNEFLFKSDTEGVVLPSSGESMTFELHPENIPYLQWGARLVKKNDILRFAKSR